ncbi:Putative nicotinamide N-methyltransferase [Podospora comata]|uniref:Nicotinamide N-methyltransferase n=1 Tax=Podospora comata TaxID=48703 RepID=A0ABY6S4L1_PODCO|nr:Putative nicotinamide N-methyltransferase [Podospora comata]
MALTSRLALTGPDTTDPEDYLSSSLGIIFPDDVTNQHGDADHGLLYTTPHLPQPLQFSLANVTEEKERHLFSHYLWNSSLMLAELIEAGTLGLDIPWSGLGGEIKDFDITGLETVELGAGTALPSIMGGLMGSKRVVVTDYPAPEVIKTLKENVLRGVEKKNGVDGRYRLEEVVVEGHGWGELETPLAEGNKHQFDRVFVADCLWMPWQHVNLRRSVGWFLREDEDARAWVVAGFHTGREKMRGFFDKEKLAEVGLEVERLWERDCDGGEREWVWDRGVEDISVRKRWLAVGVLRRIRKSE